VFLWKKVDEFIICRLSLHSWDISKNNNIYPIILINQCKMV